MAFTLAKTVEILERTPAAFDALLRGTSPSWHRTAEGPGTWSAFDVVAHLIHADEANWLPRHRAANYHQTCSCGRTVLPPRSSMRRADRSRLACLASHELFQTF